MQVMSTLNLTVSPPASWVYSKWPLTLPSAYLSASNASGWLTTSTPKTFGNGIVQWMPPLADSTTGLPDCDAAATGTASRPAIPASAKTLRRRIDSSSTLGRGQELRPRSESSLRRGPCLERALPVLERAEPGLLAISRRGGADVPPEDAREVALVGKARTGRDLGQRCVAS